MARSNLRSNQLEQCRPDCSACKKEKQYFEVRDIVRMIELDARADFLEAEIKKGIFKKYWMNGSLISNKAHFRSLETNRVIVRSWKKTHGLSEVPNWLLLKYDIDGILFDKNGKKKSSSLVVQYFGALSSYLVDSVTSGVPSLV